MARQSAAARSRPVRPCATTEHAAAQTAARTRHNVVAVNETHNGSARPPAGRAQRYTTHVARRAAVRQRHQRVIRVAAQSIAQPCAAMRRTQRRVRVQSFRHVSARCQIRVASRKRTAATPPQTLRYAMRAVYVQPAVRTASATLRSACPHQRKCQPTRHDALPPCLPRRVFCTP